jgi:cupin superfamily acireductone dioxygenase involved in methionine salvage
MSLLELSLRTHNLILAPSGDDHWFTILDSKDLLAAAGGLTTTQ